MFCVCACVFSLSFSLYFQSIGWSVGVFVFFSMVCCLRKERCFPFGDAERRAVHMHRRARAQITLEEKKTTANKQMKKEKKNKTCTVYSHCVQFFMFTPAYQQKKFWDLCGWKSVQNGMCTLVDLRMVEVHWYLKKK